MKIIVLFLIVFSAISFLNFSFASEIANNPKNIVMSYKWGGGFSPYGFTYVDIYENREVLCHFNYMNKEYKTALKLDENQFNDFISLYKKADFFNIKPPKGQEFTDAGVTTLYLKIDGKEKELKYCHLENQAINELLSRYSDIVISERCLVNLSNYEKFKNSLLIEDLAVLERMKPDNIYHIKELESFVMKIIADNRFSWAAKQAALHVLENISTGDCTPVLLSLLKDENFHELDVLEVISSVGDYRAFEILLDILQDKDGNLYFKEIAAKGLSRITKQPINFDSTTSREEQKIIIEKLKIWWMENKDKL